MGRKLVRENELLRIRSAERTEVHLIATIRFRELTFCPSMRSSGVRKEVRHARKTPPIESESRSSQVSSQGLAQRAYRPHSRRSPADQGISPGFRSGHGR